MYRQNKFYTNHLKAQQGRRKCEKNCNDAHRDRTVHNEVSLSDLGLVDELLVLSVNLKINWQGAWVKRNPGEAYIYSKIAVFYVLSELYVQNYSTVAAIIFWLHVRMWQVCFNQAVYKRNG